MHIYLLVFISKKMVLRTAAQNEMREDKMLEFLLPFARPIYVTALSS